MSRLRIAVSLLALVTGALSGASAGAQPAAPAKIEQASWNSLKRPVRLASGLNLAYVELGNPKGRPLLLLHGFTDTSRSWSLIAPYLSDHRLLIPDQRGHGAADAPPCCYSSHVYADDARQFMDLLGLERVAVLGHSMGSMTAITMASEYPDRVTEIVLIGSTALAPVSRGSWLYDNATSVTFPIDPSSEFMREWHPSNQPTPVDAAFAEEVMNEILVIPPQVWRGVMRELAGVPVGRHAVDVKASVLLLSGGKDPLFTAAHHESLVKAFPQAEAHVFPQLGHNPIWEQAEDLAAVINAFLAK